MKMPLHVPGETVTHSREAIAYHEAGHAVISMTGV